jgi:GTPase SAR1 family protein
MEQNSLIFLESEIFIFENQMQFKHYRKFGKKTVLSNFQNSKMSEKYLKANVITQCNDVLDSCSSFEIVLSCLEDLKDLLYRNEYPRSLVREKIDIFLNSAGNPDLPDFNALLCLNYTSPQTEYYARKLLGKMKLLLPNCHVSLALQTVKISKLFSKSAKAPPKLGVPIPLFKLPTQIIVLYALANLTTSVDVKDFLTIELKNTGGTLPVKFIPILTLARFT